MIYIILNYINYDATVQCICSIKSHSMYEKIIVVDNGSPNGSGDILENLYADDSNILVIKSQKNLGFANGFNLGIKYARNNFKGDYICLLNNDTELISYNWDSIIKNKYDEYNFAVLGPDIINLDGEHGNPRGNKQYSFSSALFMALRKTIEYLIFLLFNIDIIAIVEKRKNIIPQGKELYLEDCTGVELQGSCFILSEKFFLHEDGLFKGTFLYFEEAILKYICDRDKIIISYTNDLVLLHKEGLATKSLKMSDRKKRIFELKNSAKSRIALVKLILSDRKHRRN